MRRRKFADRADAGRQLGATLFEAYGARGDVIVLGVEPLGLEVAVAAGAVLGLPVVGLPRDAVLAPDLVGGAVVLVVDDGVEGGSTATRLGAVLRAADPARLVLAVPVCPREPYSSLSRVYDEVIALEKPLMARSLSWHYAQFPDAADPRVP